MHLCTLKVETDRFYYTCETVENVTWIIEQVTYPNMMEFFESLGVDMELSDMSFSVSLDKGRGCEWGSRNGLSSLFAQKMNVLNPYFWQMIREIIKFKDDVARQVVTYMYIFICYLWLHSNNCCTHFCSCLKSNPCLSVWFSVNWRIIKVYEHLQIEWWFVCRGYTSSEPNGIPIIKLCGQNYL